MQPLANLDGRQIPLAPPSARAVVEPDPARDTPRYVVGAMMTPSHARFGARLADSCRAHSMPLALFEVPSVHRSISVKGTDDPRYTKPHFIRFLLDRFACPVLYLDVDCVIAERPSCIDGLIAARTDFAIFNWFAEVHTEAYVPTAITLEQGAATRVTHDRFYRFSHSVDWLSETQLFCSGAVQWYRNSDAARRLLAQWHKTIERSPGRADDKCLDYAFNNFGLGDAELQTAWLQKRYARYAWWIYERPVIDHPDLPHSGEGFLPFDGLDGKPRVHLESLRAHAVDYVFSKPSLIDTQTRTLFRLGEGRWETAGSFTTPLWLSPMGGARAPAGRPLPPIHA